MRHPNTVPDGIFAHANPLPTGIKLRRDPTVADVMAAFEQFKSTNDAEIKALKDRGAADPLVTDKLNKIDAFMTDAQAQLDDLAKRQARAGAPAEGEKQDPEAIQYRSDFHAYFRRGVETERLQKRAMSVADNSQGGYFTSIEVDNEISKLARDASPVREIATVSQISGTAWKKRVSKSNNSSGWVGEQSDRPATNTNDFVEVTITPHEIYAMPQATQNLLDDATLNIDAWIAEETNAEFSRAEGEAFVIGNGLNRPQGLVPGANDITLETDTSFAAQGKVGYLKTGSTSLLGATAGVAEADKLIDLQTQLRDQYQPNARWLMNRFTLRNVRKIKDDNDQYIWQPGLDRGSPGMILGKPYTILDHMPAIGSNNIPVMYGDFRQFYRVIDRIGVRILRDPFSLKPYVLFYTTKRVGGGRVLTEAAKALRCAT